MKKFLAVIGLVAVGLVAVAPVVNADPEVSLTYPPTSANVNIKATICHWANGNLSEPSVDLSAVADSQDTGHGLLTLTVTGSLGSFVPHESPPGHEQDAIIDIYLKHGNDVVFLYQANTLCNPASTTTTTAPPTTTTTAPPTTTTTAPPVTTTTQAPVTTTTQARALTCPEIGKTNFPTTDRNLDQDGDGIGCEADIGTFEPGEDGVHGGPAPGTTDGQLPRTGTGSSLLALLGAWLVVSGLASVGISKFIKARAL